MFLEFSGFGLSALTKAVADPGFSPGGAPTPKNAIIFQFFAENCMKMKEFGPPGGGVRPWHPPLDPPMQSALTCALSSAITLCGENCPLRANNCILLTIEIDLDVIYNSRKVDYFNFLSEVCFF